MFDKRHPQAIERAQNNVKKKTFTYSEKSEEDRSAYLEKLEEVPVEKRVYVDESGIDKHIVRERGRAARGVKIEDVKRGRKFERINVVAAQVRSSSGDVHCVAPFCYTENTTGDLFENWFKKKLVKSVEKGSTIIMDNASFHRKKKLRNLSRRHGVKLLFLPAYSPDLNPIEKTWANMKRALADIVPKVAHEASRLLNNLQNSIYRYFHVIDF